MSGAKAGRPGLAQAMEMAPAQTRTSRFPASNVVHHILCVMWRP